MSNTINNSFSGSYVALITPMSDNGEVDLKCLKKLVDWHVDQGTDGLVVLGTTAETATLSDDEQMLVLETVIEHNAGRLPIIVGNGSNSTQATIDKTKQLDALPIQGYLTVTPFYNKPNQKGMVAHFKAVAAVTDKPIILYNVPARTGVDLSNESVLELIAVENIIGIKDATGDLSRVAVMKQADNDFLLYSGDDASALEYLKLGGDGVITVTGNVEPALMSQLVKTAKEAPQQAAEIDKKLSALHTDLFVEPNPVPAKWALWKKGVISSDMVRLPLIKMEPSSQELIKQALLQAES